MMVEVIESFEEDVSIRAKMDEDPTVVAVFDGEERVSEWTAALQTDDLAWYASGYVEGKRSDDD